MTYQEIGSLRQESSHMSQPFYFGYINRLQAEQYLIFQGLNINTYLVREGEGGYRISVLTKVKGNMEVLHYKVDTDAKGNYYLFKELVFADMFKLIEHYSKKDCGLPCRFLYPCPKRRLSTAPASPTGPLKPDVKPAKIKGPSKASKTIKKISTVRFPKLGKKSPYQNTLQTSTAIKEEPEREKELVQQLAIGQYAQIWKGKFSNNCNDVVFKMAAIAVDEVYKEVLTEQAGALQLLRHNHIVKVLDFVHENQPYIAFPYHPNKDISNYLLVSGNYETEYKQRQRMAAEVAGALKFISKMGYVHRNVKASNVLVDRDLTCKLSGFSYVKKLNNGFYYSKESDIIFPENYARWLAPEASLQGEFSTATDVWAFASFVYELFTNGEAPFFGIMVNQVQQNIRKGVRPARPQAMPMDLYELLLRCWTEQFNLRPSFDNLENSICPNVKKVTPTKAKDNNAYEEFSCRKK